MIIGEILRIMEQFIAMNGFEILLKWSLKVIGYQLLVHMMKC